MGRRVRPKRLLTARRYVPPLWEPQLVVFGICFRETEKLNWMNISDILSFDSWLFSDSFEQTRPEVNSHTTGQVSYEAHTFITLFTRSHHCALFYWHSSSVHPYAMLLEGQVCHDAFSCACISQTGLALHVFRMRFCMHLLHPPVRATWSQDSVVGIATSYGLDRGVGVRVPVGSRIFSSSRRPDRLWGPPRLPSNGYRG
jgi:hypothetical protein